MMPPRPQATAITTVSLFKQVQPVTIATTVKPMSSFATTCLVQGPAQGPADLPKAMKLELKALRAAAATNTVAETLPASAFTVKCTVILLQMLARLLNQVRSMDNFSPFSS